MEFDIRMWSILEPVTRSLGALQQRLSVATEQSPMHLQLHSAWADQNCLCVYPICTTRWALCPLEIFKRES
jgi:hypothetical protein